MSSSSSRNNKTNQQTNWLGHVRNVPPYSERTVDYSLCLSICVLFFFLFFFVCCLYRTLYYVVIVCIEMLRVHLVLVLFDRSVKNRAHTNTRTDNVYIIYEVVKFVNVVCLTLGSHNTENGNHTGYNSLGGFDQDWILKFCIFSISTVTMDVNSIVFMLHD